jgi:hypothetical protein
MQIQNQIKIQIPSTKLQINLEFQYSTTKTFKPEIRKKKRGKRIRETTDEHE